MSLNKLPLYLYKNVLPLGFTLIIFIMVFTSYVVTSQMNKNSELIMETVEQHTYNNSLLVTMSQSALNRSIILIEMIQTDDPFLVEELFLKFNALATQFVVARNKLKNQKLNPELQMLIDKQGRLQQINKPLLARVVELIQEDKKTQAVDLFNSEARPRQKVITKLIEKMVSHQSVATQNALGKIQHGSHKLFSNILIFNVSSVLISILLTLLILIKQKRGERKLSVLATTDTLTKLPNRLELLRSIDKLIATKPSAPFALIFFDIDYFKSINDNYGHDAGDAILRRFAAKIKSLIKEGDVLSRFGGDEFVLLLQSIKAEDEARFFVKMLSSKLDTSFVVNNEEIFISSSIGASLYLKDGDNAKSLLKMADIALYSAKESGRNCYSFYSKEVSKQLEKEHAICHSLHSIIKNNNKNKELYLMYQPLLDVKSGDIKECEALIRWNNEKGESISPDEFIPLAEKSNLIEKINSFVVDEACHQQSQWQQEGINDVRININLSGNKVIFPKLLTQFKANLHKLNLKPSLFGIELTERTLFEISDATINELDELRKQGVKIAIDDFGTGYSSLTYLKKLPITTLKIDKGFISGLPEDKDDLTLVKAIINLGHSLDLDIVAEGVETNEQLEFLHSYACNTVQGYFFHRPLKCEQISELKIVA